MAVSSPVRYRDGAAVIDLPALIDHSAEPSLNQAYAVAADHGAKLLVLNFGEVEFLSSTGIALIVGLLARARKEGRTMRATGLSEHYREIFEITRLVDFMTIYADENAALEEGKR